MKKSLAIAYAVKRKAKGMSAGGRVEPEADELMSMDEGGEGELMEERSEAHDDMFAADDKSPVAQALDKVRRRNLGK